MRVSVVIPVFNTAPYLDACLESVLGQEEKEIEVICVDDGSTDRSADVLARWSRRDPRIHVISQRNAGQGAARNRGTEKATGDYLLFVDSDDVLMPSAIRLLLREVGEAQVIAFEHVTFVGTPPSSQALDVAASEVPREQLLRQMGVVWNKMARRDWWVSQDLRFREGVIFEDIPVHWQMVLLPERIRHLPSALYALRVRPDSTTGSNITTPRRLDSVRAHNAVAELFAIHPGWAEYEQVRREMLLRNLAGCIDGLREADAETLGQLRALASPQLAMANLATGYPPGLTMRERWTIQAHQGDHLASWIVLVVRMSRKVYRRLRSLVRS
jgi:glycosyltransferase involved in cell wall biosynthesis